jgi:hypothetical protein
LWVKNAESHAGVPSQATSAAVQVPVASSLFRR